MTTVTEARRRPRAEPIPADVRALLQAGKLEETCPDCGRTEAAHRRCSWCYRPMGPDDWYRNRDRAERDRRMPTTAPTNPPTEFRGTYRLDKGDGWPPQWGPNPYAKARQTADKPVKPGPDDTSGTSAAARSDHALSPSTEPDGRPTAGAGFSGSPEPVPPDMAVGDPLPGPAANGRAGESHLAPPVPTSREVSSGGYALPLGTSRDAGPALDPGPRPEQRPDFPNLGL